MSFLQKVLPFLYEDANKAAAELKSIDTRALAVDANEDARITLARRMVTLLPELDDERHAETYAATISALGKLAEDEITRVRVALSSALKDVAHFPPKLARQLAQDAERAVAIPILQHAVTLPDSDLLAVIQSHPQDERVEVIASRPKLSEPVSNAVIESGNDKAGRALIQNDGARIAPDTLQKIVARAKELPEWQTALKDRQSLPRSIRRELRTLGADILAKYLADREELHSGQEQEVLEAVARRVAYGGDQEKMAQTAVQLASEDKLNAEIISDALALGDHEFVKDALTVMASSDRATIDKLCDSASPKGLVALCWHLQFSMRFAVTLQQRLLKVRSNEVLYARGGTDYPLDDSDLVWQLEFWGIK